MPLRKLSEQDGTPSPEYFVDFSPSYSEEVDELLRQLMTQKLIEENQDFANTFYTHLNNRAGACPARS